MCVLKDTYLGEDIVVLRERQVEVQEERKLHLVVKTHVETRSEPRRETHLQVMTSYYWCRSCFSKHPIKHTKSCDCGIIICNTCLEEYEGTCPICDATLA